MDAVTTPPRTEQEAETPLIPAVLLGPTAFLWLWALPIAVLLLLNVQAYWLVEGNLSADQRHDALLIGGANLANFLIGLAIYFVGKNRNNLGAVFERQVWWAAPAILVQTGYLWWAVAWTDHILPASVTSWIYPTERHLFNQFAFAMLPLSLGILRLASARPPKNFGRTIAINVGIALAGPVVLYLCASVFSTFRGFNEIAGIIFATGVVVLGIMMFIGLVRALMLALRGLRRWGSTGEQVAIVIFAVVLPIAGLLLNRSIPFPVDFQAWEIYALVLLNAGILLLASFKPMQWPKLSFHLLCASFPFSLYFFIVFLPYTPLSILAIIAMGAGFLVLAPIFLFVLHLVGLHKARTALGLNADGRRYALTGILCFLILPAFFTARGLADKTALNAALDYVYSPAITSEKLIYPASLTNLRRALSNHRSYKNGIYYPLLSDFYTWLVFDNLVLGDDKLDRLEKTFFGAAGSRLNLDPLRKGLNVWGARPSVRDRARMPRAVPTPRTVEISKLDLQRAVAGDADTVVTMTLTLRNAGTAPAEFIQKLPLPSGIFVSGFRLHIKGQAVPGRIFEKKTALWVYTMIRDSERRDPGLLYYNTRDELELRVFPVATQAPTTVEIDFLLPGAISSENLLPRSHDPAAVLTRLGQAIQPQLVGERRELAAAGLAAEKFPPATRETYLHLLIDRSLDNPYRDDLAAIVGTLQEKYPTASLARVTLVNHDVVDLAPQLTSLTELTKNIRAEALENLPISGGFALDLAVARAIRQHRDRDLDHYAENKGLPLTPVFVILSGKAAPRTLELDLTQTWSDLLPGLAIAEVGRDRTFHVHRQENAPAAPLLRLGNAVRPLSARQTLRFPGPGPRGEVALTYWSPQNFSWQSVPQVERRTDSALWSRAVALQLQEQDHGRMPGAYRLDRKAVVTASRESGILLPTTSYIVVENSAQWRMLELSERQKLDQNAALDFRETPAPPAVLVGVGLVLWIGFRRWRRRRALALSYSDSVPALRRLENCSGGL